VNTSHKEYAGKTHFVWYFLQPVKRSDVIQCVYGRRQPTVQTKYLQHKMNNELNNQ
jgi:hypothetical protein